MNAGKVLLTEVTAATVLDICRLSPLEEQKKFVAPNSRSIAEAHFQPEYAWFRAIYADDTPVGFVMIGHHAQDNFCFLWRFMIDAKYQGQGFGKQALSLVLAHIQSMEKVTKVITSFVPRSGNPSSFYKKCGFQPVGNLNDYGALGDKINEYSEIGLEYIF